MRALDRKLARDLGRLWAQGLAIALVLGCGLAVMVMANGMLRSLSETRAAYYERHRFADVFAAATRVPDGVLARIAAIDGVAQAEARVAAAATVDLPGMDAPATARILSLPADGSPRLNVPLLRTGRLPAPLAPDEALVSEPFAEAHGLRPGDRLAVTLNGQRRTLRLTGTVLSPEFVYAIGPGSIMPDDRRFGVIWMNRAPLAAAADLGGAFNDLSVGLARHADEAAVIAALDAILAPYGGTGAHGRDRQQSHMFLDNELRELTNMATVAPPVFLIVSAFLVNMVLGRLVGLERTQVGLLKAIGYSTAAIGWHYLKLALAIGAAGVLLGLGLGWWGGQWMADLYARYFRFPFLIYRPGAGAVGLAVGLGLATVTVGAARAVWGSVRLPPATAMAPPAPPVFRRGWVDRLGRLAAFRQTTMMILRSVARWPGRAAVTFLGVAASLAVMVALFSVFDSMELLMDEVFVLSNRQDVTLMLTRPATARAVTDAAALPGVRLAEGAFALPVRLSHGPRERLSVLRAWDDAPELSRLVGEGAALALPRDGLVLPEGLAQALAAAPGDIVRVDLLAPPRETWLLPVTGTLRQSLGQEAHMAAPALFARMRTAPQVTQVNLLVDHAQLPALNARVKETPAVAGLVLWSDVRAQLDATVNRSVGVATTIFAVAGMLITIGVIYNAARIQLSERAHELASLRVLGFTRAEVGYVLVGEMMFLSVAAVPAGWLGGWAFARAIHAGYQTDIVSLPFVMAPGSFGLATLLVVATALVSSLWVRRRLDRVNLAEALKRRE